MYTFRPATDRIRKLRELIRDRVIRYDAERLKIVTEAYQANEYLPSILKRPLAFKALCERMTVLVEDFEIIVGNKGPHFFSSPQYPEWGISDWLMEPIEKGEWTIREDGLYHNPDTEELRNTISPEDYAVLKELLPWWKYRKVGTVADAWQPRHHAELKKAQRLQLCGRGRHGPHRPARGPSGGGL